MEYRELLRTCSQETAIQSTTVLMKCSSIISDID